MVVTGNAKVPKAQSFGYAQGMLKMETGKRMAAEDDVDLPVGLGMQSEHKKGKVFMNT
jgi:hypothetical protein